MIQCPHSPSLKPLTCEPLGHFVSKSQDSLVVHQYQLIPGYILLTLCQASGMQRCSYIWRICNLSRCEVTSYQTKWDEIQSQRSSGERDRDKERHREGDRERVVTTKRRKYRKCILSYIKISYNYFVRMMIIFEILSRCELQFRNTCPARSMWS